MNLFLDSRPKKGLSSNDFTKTVTLRLRSIVPKRPTAHGLLRSYYRSKRKASPYERKESVDWAPKV